MHSGVCKLVDMLIKATGNFKYRKNVSRNGDSRIYLIKRHKKYQQPRRSTRNLFNNFSKRDNVMFSGRVKFVFEQYLYRWRNKLSPNRLPDILNPDNL